MSKKHVGSTLDSLFEELGESQDLKLLTLKKVLADQLRERMVAAGITRAALATAMHTSRTVTHRLLDPNDTGVTLDTIVRASDALGMDVAMSFRVRPKSSKRLAKTA